MKKKRMLQINFVCRDKRAVCESVKVSLIMLRACFTQEFACNGTVIEHPEYGEVLQLQGDQRENICQWLTKSGLAKPDQLKVHGF